jgi:hypothetical protein
MGRIVKEVVPRLRIVETQSMIEDEAMKKFWQLVDSDFDLNQLTKVMSFHDAFRIVKQMITAERKKKRNQEQIFTHFENAELS